MNKDQKMMTATEVAEYLRVSRTQAYRIVKKLNLELTEQGFYIVAGKVNRAYFFKKFDPNYDQNKGRS